MGDNRTFSVSQSFPSTYQLCDNRWHSVKANYVENALTLKVDNQDEQYGFSTNGQVKEAKTRNPLFIGGLPGKKMMKNICTNLPTTIFADSELEPQGALRVRDNFKGCIRNVVIRGEIKDWTDMARLNNVLLNACPTN